MHTNSRKNLCFHMSYPHVHSKTQHKSTATCLTCDMCFSCSEVELQAEETEVREERSSAGGGLMEEEKEKQKFEERSVSVTQHSSSIAEEVRRLLKEQGEAQGEETSPQPARVSRTKAKKRQVRREGEREGEMGR